MTNARFSYRLTQEQFEQALTQNPALEFVSIQQPSNGQWIVPAKDISELNAETAARLIEFHGFVSIDRAAFQQAAAEQHVDDDVTATGQVVRPGWQKIVEATSAMYADEFGFTGGWRTNKGLRSRPETVGRSIVFEATSNLANEGTAPIAVLREVGKAEMAVLTETVGNGLPAF